MYGHVILAGNLGADPEKRKTSNGDTFVTFSLAVQLEGHDGPATWFDVSVFNERPGKFVAKHVKKGSSVIISGSLRPNEYEKKDGSGTVKTFSVRADEVNFVSSGKKKDDDGGSSDEGTFGGDSSGGDGEDW